jgi:hypothetical protein
MFHIKVIFKVSSRTSKRTHFVSVIKTKPVMRDREIIAVCPEINTKHISGTVWAESRILEPGGACSNHWALNG